MFTSVSLSKLKKKLTIGSFNLKLEFNKNRNTLNYLLNKKNIDITPLSIF